MTGSDTVTAYISIGSNLGDRAGNLLMAVRGLIEASLPVTRLSAIYETEPVGVADAPDFLNMVAEVRTVRISPAQMLARLLRIEYLLGRTDKSLKRPRTIDLDLIFFGKERMDTPFLTVPHRQAHLRRFVLLPMSEIAPDYRHPLLKRTVSQLLEECPDTSHVVRWHPYQRENLPAERAPI